jgi:hypothetical protein
MADIFPITGRKIFGITPTIPDVIMKRSALRLLSMRYCSLRPGWVLAYNISKKGQLMNDLHNGSPTVNRLEYCATTNFIEFKTFTSFQMSVQLPNRASNAGFSSSAIDIAILSALAVMSRFTYIAG